MQLSDGDALRDRFARHYYWRILNDEACKNLARRNIHAIAIWAEEFVEAEIRQGFSEDDARDLIAKVINAAITARLMLSKTETGQTSG